jgi:hypothetical protein
MKKIIRYLLLSSLLSFVMTQASAQSKGKYKREFEKHRHKAGKEKTEKRNYKADKEKIEKHKQKTGKEKQKAHEKKLKANKEYAKTEKQRRKEKANDEN